MKVQAITIGLLLLAASVSTQTPVTTSCNRDSTMANPNHFLAWLYTVAPTAVFSQVQASPPMSATSWAVCDGVWKANGGTCCDATALQSAFDTNYGKIRSSWQNYVSSLKKVRNNLAKIKKVMVSKDDAKAKFAEMKADSTKYDLGGLDENQAAGILAKIDTWETALGQFKTNGKTCFNAVIPNRGKIFCVGCSATGFNYFTSGPVLTLKTGSCNDILSACSQAWKFMIDTQSILYLTALLNKKRSGGSGKNPAVDIKKFFQNSATTLGAYNQWQDKCPTGQVTATCSQADLDTICAAIFNFAKTEGSAEQPVSDEDSDGLSPATRLLPSTSSRITQAGTYATTSAGGVTTSSTGVDIKPLAAALTTNTNVDFNQAESASIAGKLAISLFMFVALLLVLLN